MCPQMTLWMVEEVGEGEQRGVGGFLKARPHPQDSWVCKREGEGLPELLLYPPPSSRTWFGIHRRKNWNVATIRFMNRWIQISTCISDHRCMDYFISRFARVRIKFGMTGWVDLELIWDRIDELLNPDPSMYFTLSMYGSRIKFGMTGWVDLEVSRDRVVESLHPDFSMHFYAIDVWIPNQVRDDRLGGMSSMLLFWINMA